MTEGYTWSSALGNSLECNESRYAPAEGVLAAPNVVARRELPALVLRAAVPRENLEYVLPTPPRVHGAVDRGAFVKKGNVDLPHGRSQFWIRHLGVPTWSAVVTKWPP